MRLWCAMPCGCLRVCRTGLSTFAHWMGLTTITTRNRRHRPPRSGPLKPLDGLWWPSLEESWCEIPISHQHPISRQQKTHNRMTGWKACPTYDLRGCAQALVQSARPVICIGESGPVFAEAVRGLLGPEDPGRVRLAGGLVEAVQIARAAARPGDAVLFSPGAPSFDAYANFVDRGRHFLDTVKALTPERA